MRKHIAALIVITIALSVSHTVIAQHSHHEHQTEQEQEQNSDKRQKYTCPMHPEVITDHPGNCPKCGMKLVPKDQKKRSTLNAQRSTLNAQ